MNDRRSKSKAKNKTMAWTAAGLVHLLIIGAVVFNFTSEPDTIQAFEADTIADTVKATVVDESEIKNRQDELKQKDLDKKRKEEHERKRLRELQRQAEFEKRSIADLQKQKEIDQQAADDAERKRKEVKLRAEKEELERLKKEAARKKREEAERKQRQRIAVEKKKTDELNRIKREQQEIEAQQRLNQLIEEESIMLQQQQQEQNRQNDLARQQSAQRTTTVINQYFSLIGKKIEAGRSVDPSFETWRKSIVEIKVSSSGNVILVRTIESSGSARYDKSVEAAVLKASPLPMPNLATEPEANAQLREFEFEVNHPNSLR
ncbi:MAG: colicin import membrane protein [Cryomorphaceae bacterium]|jgi:colicin import membrane protein